MDEAQLAGVHAKASGNVVRSVALVAQRTASLVEKLNAALEREAFELPETREFEEGADVRVLREKEELSRGLAREVALSNQLLSQMLPKRAVEDLRHGVSVPPPHYDEDRKSNRLNSSHWCSS
mgnify:CR=1 FL=1